MNSPEERWWTVRAGEYVLGTLRGQDLELFERILAHDVSMQAEVGRWERRLGALGESTRAEPPGEHVWPLILERIRRSEAAAPGTVPDDVSDPDAVAGGRPGVGPPRSAAEAGRSVGVDAPRSRAVAERSIGPGAPRTSASANGGRVSMWRAIAGLATAASVVLAVLLFQRTDFLDPDSLRVDGLAVVLSDEEGQPYFLVETDYDNGRVRVTALTPPALEDDRNFQLWQALPDRSSVRPVALLPRESGRSRTFEITSLIEGSDLFGVSLEPDGAPTDGGPTGPVVAHGDFLPKRVND